MNEFLLRNKMFSRMYKVLLGAGLTESSAQNKMADMLKESRSDMGYMSIEDINAKVKSCRACYGQSLVSELGPVPGFGKTDDSGHADILFVGEMVGPHEEEQGKPFVGPNSKVFSEAARAVRIASSDIPAYATNLVCCRPSGEHPRARQIENCTAFLDPILMALMPNIIVPLGSIALKHFFGSQAKIEDFEGEVTVIGAGFLCIPLRHPSALHRIPDEAARKESFQKYHKQFEGLVSVNKKVKELRAKGAQVQLEIGEEPLQLLSTKWVDLSGENNG